MNWDYHGSGDEITLLHKLVYDGSVFLQLFLISLARSPVNLGRLVYELTGESSHKVKLYFLFRVYLLDKRLLIYFEFNEELRFSHPFIILFHFIEI